MAAKIDRLKIINKRLRPTVDENGNIAHDKQVPMYLDATGSASFVFVPPQYVSDALELTNGRISKPTADEAEKAYTETIDRFAKWKRTTVAELVILVKMNYENQSEGKRRGFSYGTSVRASMVELGYSLAYRVPHPGGAKIYERKVKQVPAAKREDGSWSYERDTDPPEYELGASFYPHDVKIFRHTTELQAKLDLVMKAIGQAADVLAGIDSDDEKAFVAGMLGLGSKTPLLTVA